jgi:hypothetical protein
MILARYLNPKGVAALNRTLTLQVTALLTWSFPFQTVSGLVNLAPHVHPKLTVHKGFVPPSRLSKAINYKLNFSAWSLLKGRLRWAPNVVLVMPHAILASALMVTCVQQCVPILLTVPAAPS